MIFSTKVFIPSLLEFGKKSISICITCIWKWTPVFICTNIKNQIKLLKGKWYCKNGNLFFTISINVNFDMDVLVIILYYKSKYSISYTFAYIIFLLPWWQGLENFLLIELHRLNAHSFLIAIYFLLFFKFLYSSFL